MKYHVYGMGNALVDTEFEVNDQFLSDHEIEKGMMTLIDEEKHDSLLENLADVFGLKKRAGGGSAANTMVALSQLGGKAFYACKVADDETGRFYAENLKAAGVSTKLEEMSHEGTTGKCMVMVTPDAERTMNTFLGITADFSIDELHIDELSESEYLYIEGYFVTSDVSRAAAIKAKAIAEEKGVKVAMTFSDPSMVTYFREGVDEIFGDGVDLLFCNQEELATFTGEQDLQTAVKSLSAKVGKLVVTLGAEGALVVSGGQQTSIDGHVVEAVDTNGAGDMFAGAFLYGITHGMDDAQAGRLASKAASQVVTVFGARLDDKTYQDLLSGVEV